MGGLGGGGAGGGATAMGEGGAGNGGSAAHAVITASAMALSATVESEGFCMRLIAYSERVAMRQALTNLLRLGLGVVVGLAAAEEVFRLRDHGTFPRLNVYEADATLGVRLRPGATESIQFNGNPTSRVHVNGLGFRGEDPPPPGKGEILFVGDSQLFGLGVDDAESFASDLRAALPTHYLFNAGVPTYGPPEYFEVTKRMLTARQPTTVVYVVNLVNDLFEAARPNVDRHAALDGWALRKESVPSSVTRFPGRDLLLGHSHAVLAYRAWRHDPGDPTAGSDPMSPPFASEGTWQDLLGRTADVQARAEARHGAQDELDRFADALLKEEAKRQQALEHERLVRRDPTLAYRARVDGQRREQEGALADAVLSGPEGKEYERTGGDPSAIRAPEAREYYAELSRPVTETSEVLLSGAEVRKRVEAALKVKADALEAEQEADLLKVPVAERAGIRDAMSARQAKLRSLLAGLSPLREPLTREAELCASAGARLVVLVLPIDVQVSASEWAKYRQAPIDMTPTEGLIDEIVALGRELDVPVWNALPALRAAEPGAFLMGDIHMSPKGHRAVADGFAAFFRSEAHPR